MNKLEAVIIDQHARVRDAGANSADALTESQGEILAAATPELTLRIIREHHAKRPDSEIFNIGAILRAQSNPDSTRNRCSAAIKNGVYLGENNIVAAGQGYTGGIVFDNGEPLVYGYSADFGRIKEDDEIQEVMSTFYPPMMWAKALRAEAYRNRPESARRLSIAKYLASLGLSLGASLSPYGDIAGATGFMPGTRLYNELGDEAVLDHVYSAPAEAFRLSSLCDQAVLDPTVLENIPSFTAGVLRAGGSLN